VLIQLKSKSTHILSSHMIGSTEMANNCMSVTWRNLPVAGRTSGQTTSGRINSGRATSGQTTSERTTSARTTSGRITSGQTTSGRTTFLPLPQAWGEHRKVHTSYGNVVFRRQCANVLQETSIQSRLP
jgi:hypothetical protein